MFRVKICGIRLKSDVDAVAAAGGDAVGLNFFRPSVRFVDPQSESTRLLSEAAAAAKLLRVGVFVNETADQIHQIVDQVGLDAVQLHGDETLSAAGTVRGPRLRAIKLPVGPVSVDLIESAARPWIDAGFHVLFDADAGAAHGGSGKYLDWKSVADWNDQHGQSGWTLAGGLNPQNVAEAIRTSGTASVDTASGVESPKGVKSAALIQQFLQQASG
ncbi:N-(5'-phosphoribosyl)anthranilate isomerase [Rubripirellula lacrimiformis]|uniref:N-(5'-phosphoribosyl)anthranilate isomerase n=1 Tax=Rubripirellula lacrimiformis TaxID=1930273 RepID=A0A517NEM1_9BACT|nr:phosphoribosylanthranilate isomerase [Rubripirellula lacrimiformis]QDT05576.1 N-(5'-phosphoribosyl)anthranilate isomerase [Rubripirellula lacrimiformis]